MPAAAIATLGKLLINNHLAMFAQPCSIYGLKAAFHDTDTDILAPTCPTRLYILARILARMSVSVSWNAALTGLNVEYRADYD